MNRAAMWRRLDKYIEIAKKSMQAEMTYPPFLVVRLLGFLINFAVFYYVWKAIYTDLSSLGGLGLQQMLTYLCISSAISALLNKPHELYILGKRIRSGDIALCLVQPVDMQARFFSEAIGSSVVLFAMFCVPMLAVTGPLLKISPPPSIGHLILFTVSFALGYAIMLGLDFLVGLLGFSTIQFGGLIVGKRAMIRFFSGAIVPLSIFPAQLRDIASWLPFQAIYYLPLSIYTGAFLPTQAAVAILIQIFWLIFVVLLGRLAWRWAVRAISIQGG